MRITRLYLRNYRVYEDEVDLEVPAGLVGIFGRNGAGKSTLLESITWTLWGRARTPKDQIRTSGINADCITEVEFEHEGHLYLVRRSITGIGHTVKARAHADGTQMAEGVRDVARYVHSVLGMDDIAFRASVFAEQKQLAAFSSHAPAERRKLVMQLLGITPLDTAREQARRDARERAEQLGRLRVLLPDRDQLARETQEAEQAAARAKAEAEEAATRAESARVRAQETAARLAALAEVGREYESLVKEGTALRGHRDLAARRVEGLRTELADLAAAAQQLEALGELASGLAELEQAVARAGAVSAARKALEAIPASAVPTDPATLTDACARAQQQADEARAELAQLEGRLQGAQGALAHARALADKSSALSGEADCPMCGQALGAAFAQVQHHRQQELDQAERVCTELEEALAQRREVARRTTAAAQRAATELEETRSAWETHQRLGERRQAAEEALAGAVAELGHDPDPQEEAQLRSRLAQARQAEQVRAELRGRLQRHGPARAELEAEEERLQTLDAELDNLRDKARSLSFRPEDLAARQSEAAEAERSWQAAATEAQRSAALGAAAEATVTAQNKRMADADAQHAQLEDLAEDSRHLGRLAELLSVFRNTVVASVGPRLSAQAADLFSELTDHEYDRLEVDPDTYEIQIRDGGVCYGMDRFSGSETDLANLALRVAISEHVRFQSGGVVGLLVLDEVFGPLDEERKERMLLALERLRGRFRQVLVVTHAPEIKDQLPSAIEVIKRPGRRATARVLNG